MQVIGYVPAPLSELAVVVQVGGVAKARPAGLVWNVNAGSEAPNAIALVVSDYGHGGRLMRQVARDIGDGREARIDRAGAGGCLDNTSRRVSEVNRITHIDPVRPG